MMFFKPKFWDNKINIAAISLLPLSLILLVIIFIKKFLQGRENLKFQLFVLEIYMLVGQAKRRYLFF